MTAPLYCDHNATTPMRPSAVAAMTAWLGVAANPASLHAAGRSSADAVEQARHHLSRLIGARSRDIIFTSGATEANNTALSAGLARDRRTAVITGATEHPSVLAAAAALPRHVVVPVDKSGRVVFEALETALAEHPGALVSIMAANNETGALNDLPAIAELVHRWGGLFHTDATQAVGRMPIEAYEWGIDMLSLSAHKFGGPVGTGALFISRDADMPPSPLMHGGQQEKGWRPGTVNVAGVVGCGAAAEEALHRLAPERAAAAACRDEFERSVLTTLSRAWANSSDVPRLDGVSSITVPGFPAEALLLAMPGIAASEGSACSSGAPHPSHVLTAMGLSRSDAASTVRFSFGLANHAGDGLLAANALISAVKRVSAALAVDTTQERVLV